MKVRLSDVIEKSHRSSCGLVTITLKDTLIGINVFMTSVHMFSSNIK